MNDTRLIRRYVVWDLLSSFLAWQVFNVFRFQTFRSTVGFETLSGFLLQEKFIFLGVLVPIFWSFLYFLSGYYTEPRKKTNLGDFMNAAILTLIGVIILFFLIVINDYPQHPYLYYQIVGGYLLIHLVLTSLVRYFQTNKLLVNQSKGMYSVPVLIVGTGEKAVKLRKEFNQYKSSFSYRFEGFIRVDDNPVRVDEEEVLGDIHSMPEMVKKYHIEECLFALDHMRPDMVQEVLQSIYPLNIPARAFADRQEILAGKVSLFSLFGIPLYHLTPKLMPSWQRQIKRCLDVLLSVLVMLLFSPLYAYLSLRVKTSSSGPVLYVQTRLGKQGKPFRMYKFRTMYMEAEADGPRLSSRNDERITPFGRFMRKYRLDELPQFWNVLKGDMSIVGPRPERAFFVEKIIQKSPQYLLIQQVLPGITSWGMVKFGYADTVEKMLERLEYDLMYLENQNLLLDLKILVFTIKPLLKGKGQ